MIQQVAGDSTQQCWGRVGEVQGRDNVLPVFPIHSLPSQTCRLPWEAPLGCP